MTKRQLYWTIGAAAFAVLANLYVSGFAFAADPPRGNYVSASSRPAETWTGFYAGVQGGYAWGEVDATGLPIGIGTSTDGWLAGARLGFDYQIPNTRIVAGLLAEASFADLRGTAALGGISIPAQADLIGSLRARVGYAFDGFLLYGTGGLSGARYDISISGTGLSSEATQWSWVAGAGLEAKLFNGWSVGVEYLYRGRASENACFTIAFCAPFETESQTALAYLNRRW